MGKWLQRVVPVRAADAVRLAEERAGRRLVRVQNKDAAGTLYIYLGRPGAAEESFEVAPKAFFDLRDPAPDCVIYGRGSVDLNAVVLEG